MKKNIKSPIPYFMITGVTVNQTYIHNNNCLGTVV